MLGSYVQFTWKFSGSARSVTWGSKKAGQDVLDVNLVRLMNSGPSLTTDPTYSGRVSGNGSISSGHVIFTLSSIKRSDEGYYGCRITPTDDFSSSKFDFVNLVIRGECFWKFHSVIKRDFMVSITYKMHLFGNINNV